MRDLSPYADFVVGELDDSYDLLAILGEPEPLL